MNEIEETIFHIKQLSFDITDDTYDTRIGRGHELLVKLRDSGLEKDQVYRPLIQYHNELEDGLSREYIAELLDYVVGWCSPQKKIF